MNSFLLLLSQVIDLIIWVIIIQVILSWLLVFNIINTHNPFVHMVVDTLSRLVEPMLAPIRRLLPDLGGIDISPVLLILGLIFFRNLMIEYFGGGVHFTG